MPDPAVQGSQYSKCETKTYFNASGTFCLIITMCEQICCNINLCGSNNYIVNDLLDYIRFNLNHILKVHVHVFTTAIEVWIGCSQQGGPL